MKTALITGAARGLGSGFVDALVDKGYTVFAGVRSKEHGAREFCKSEKIIEVELHVANDSSLERAAREIRLHTDTIDLIVNNAAVSRASSEIGGPEKVCHLSTLSRASLLAMFDVNAISPLLVTKHFLPFLQFDPSYIINITSARASLYKDESPNSSPNYGYRASKAALTVLTKALSEELPKNVRTFSVHPGLVRTAMNPKGALSVRESAELILGITERWQPEMHGDFLDNKGARWPT